MTYQTQSDVVVAYKVQSALGSIASGAGGTILRVAGGSGGALTKAATGSKEVRADGMMTRGRHGMQKAGGSWDTEVSLGNLETIIQAIMRDTWDVSALALNSANFTSLATATNVITLTSGDPRTLGLRVGDVIRCANLTQAAGNGKNLRITGLTATTITVDVVIGTGAVAAAATITRPKRIIQSGSLTKRYFTTDEYEVDLDQSEVMQDFVFSNMKFSMQANGIIACTVGGVNTGAYQGLTGASAPSLTGPTQSTGVVLAVADATLRLNGVDQVALTGFDITMDIGATGPDVFGSAAQKVSPDVFTGQASIGVNITALRADLQALTDFLAETQYELHVLMTENTSEPKNFLSMYMGNLTLGGAAKSAISNQAGPRSTSITVPAALVGQDLRGTGYDATMIKWQSTGA